MSPAGPLGKNPCIAQNNISFSRALMRILPFSPRPALLFFFLLPFDLGSAAPGGKCECECECE